MVLGSFISVAAKVGPIANRVKRRCLHGRDRGNRGSHRAGSPPLPRRVQIKAQSTGRPGKIARSTARYDAICRRYMTGRVLNAGGRAAVGLEVRDQHAVRQDRQPIDQPAHHSVPDHPRQRHLRAAIRPKQRRQIGMRHDRQNLIRDSFSLACRQPVTGLVEEPYSGHAPTAAGTKGKCCSRRMDQLAPPETVSAGLPLRQRRVRGRDRPELHALRPARRQRQRARWLGRRRCGDPVGRQPPSIRVDSRVAPPRRLTHDLRAEAPAARATGEPVPPTARTASRFCAGGLEPASYQIVPTLVLRRVRASASRTPAAGPRLGSERRRAAGCAPPSAAAGQRRAAGRARRSEIPCAAPTAAPRGRSSGRPPRRSPPSSFGSAAVSGTITSGACNPLAPCTVMIRTRSPAASGSRFTSAPDRRSQWRNPCREGGCGQA